MGAASQRIGEAKIVFDGDSGIRVTIDGSDLVQQVLGEPLHIRGSEWMYAFRITPWSLRWIENALNAPNGDETALDIEAIITTRQVHGL